MKLNIRLLLFITMLTFSNLIFANSLASIDSLSFEVHEVSSVNGKERTKEYSIITELPNKIRKTITAPKTNAGEVYIYSNGQKQIYLPLFKQVRTESVDSEENYIIKTIKDIKENEKNDPEFKRAFHAGEVKELVYPDGIKVTFEHFGNYQGYSFPDRFKVYENGALIATVQLKNVFINPRVSEDTFTL